MGIFDIVDRDSLEFFYDSENIATFIPFEKPEDTRADEYGDRIRDKEYLICTSDKEISAYAPFKDGQRYCKVGYVEFEKEKKHGRKQMKIWYLTVQNKYEGLGLGSMLIAGVKHKCVMERIDTLVLDAARRYKQKDPNTEVKYPQLKDDGHVFYNANLALYQSHGFEIDTESKEYFPDMEEDFYDSRPIPMVCEISDMLVPQSIFAQGSSHTQAPREQDGGMCQ